MFRLLMLAMSLLATFHVRADELSDAIRESDHAKVREILEKQNKPSGCCSAQMTDKQRAQYLKIAQETMNLRGKQLVKDLADDEVNYGFESTMLPCLLLGAIGLLILTDQVNSAFDTAYCMLGATLSGILIGSKLEQIKRADLHTLYDNSLKNYEAVYDQQSQ